MSRDKFIKEILSSTVSMTPKGFLAHELDEQGFKRIYHIVFEKIFEISKADVSNVNGYGEFDENCKLEYNSCRDFLIGTFREDREDYWYNWNQMFETTILDKDVFDKFYKKMEEKIDYCEGKRFLVNNNAFFDYMVTDGKEEVGFSDWNRAGVCDFLLDFACMDLHKPYFKIPELLFEYCKEKGIEIPDFKERFLCMAYYKGIDVLRWHASIDDVQSCKSIVKSLNELEDRIMNL